MSIYQSFKEYNFKLKHLMTFFLILVIFLTIVTMFHKSSIQSFLLTTQDWYQQESSERLANLMATSLELLLL